MSDNRNTILAVILSGLVLIAWQYFYNMPQMEKQREVQRQAELLKPTPQATPGAAPGTSTAPRRRRARLRLTLRWQAVKPCSQPVRASRSRPRA